MPMTLRDSQRTTPFTLVELLVAMAILLVLLAAIIQVFHLCCNLCGNTTQQACAVEQLAPLREEWRRLVAETAVSEWNVSAGEFRAGAARAVQKDGSLFFSTSGRTRQLALPAKAHVEFSVERDPGWADCAVLSLTWDSGRRGPQKVLQDRMVACARPAGGTK